MLKGNLRKYFITGLLIILPIVLTLWVLTKAFFLITDYLFRLIQHFYPLPSFKLDLLARLGSLVIIFLAFIIVGMLARNVFGKRLLHILDIICSRIPVFGRVYGVIKQISQAVIGQEKTIFKKAVLIEYPRRGVYSVAFLMSEGRGEVQEKTTTDVVNVFVPTTPNPTSGMLIMLPREDIIPLDMTVEDGMKLVVSGGAVVPETGLKQYGLETSSSA